MRGEKMILFTKDNLEVNSNVIGMIDKEMNIISLSMDSQNAKKAIFSDALQKIESLKNHTASPLSSDIVFLENSIKKSIALIDRNLYLLNDLEDSFDDILALDFIDTKTANEFNSNYFNTNETILHNTIEIDQTFDYVITSAEFLEESSQKMSIETVIPESLSSQENEVKQTITNESITSTTIDEELLKSFDYEKYPENTLKISYMENLVYLPYTLSLLSEIYNKNLHRYFDLEDALKKNFIVPLKFYSNTSVARFKEAYKLIRKRENGSVGKAVSLGLELFFNYNLHPAIISASKNLEELDKYLVCLNAKETDNFDCFKIIFEVSPTESKLDSRFSYLDTQKNSYKNLNKHSKSKMTKNTYN